MLRAHKTCAGVGTVRRSSCGRLGCFGADGPRAVVGSEPRPWGVQTTADPDGRRAPTMMVLPRWFYQRSRSLGLE